jgi:hypothetical protein
MLNLLVHHVTSRLTRLVCPSHARERLQICTKYSSELQNGKHLVTDIGAQVMMILAFFFLSQSDLLYVQMVIVALTTLSDTHTR